MGFLPASMAGDGLATVPAAAASGPEWVLQDLSEYTGIAGVYDSGTSTLGTESTIGFSATAGDLDAGRNAGGLFKAIDLGPTDHALAFRLEIGTVTRNGAQGLAIYVGDTADLTGDGVHLGPSWSAGGGGKNNASGGVVGATVLASPLVVGAVPSVFTGTIQLVGSTALATGGAGTGTQGGYSYNYTGTLGSSLYVGVVPRSPGSVTAHTLPNVKLYLMRIPAPS